MSEWRVIRAEMMVGLGKHPHMRPAGPANCHLYGVTPTDSLTLIAAALTMMLVSLIAGLLPARRAATVDPTIALRYE